MEEAPEKQSFWSLPTTAKGSGSLALGLTLVLELFVLALIRSGDPFFLWSLKTAFPFCSGCLAALLYSRREPCTLQECTSASLRSVASLYKLLLALAILLSPMLVMYIFNVFYLNLLVLSIAAAPFAIILAWLGGWVGYKLQMARWRYIG